jgi:hypothetical protein
MRALEVGPRWGQILIEKGVFTQDEFFGKLNQVQKEYDGKKALGQ